VKVLLVEDQTDIRDVLVIVLKMKEYEVVPFDCALPALAWFAVSGQVMPDVVVTDYNLTCMNGAELARDVKGFAPNIPVILITGNLGDVSDEERGLVDGILRKPFQPDALTDMIQRVVNSKVKENLQPV